jgi:hypothetical protein
LTGQSGEADNERAMRNKKGLRKRRPPPPGARLSAPSLEDLLRRTRTDLLKHARRVGLKGVQRLTKAALAVGIARALERPAPAAAAPEPVEDPRKFDLGLTASDAAREAKEDIPWGYGQDRVTAMAVDPERLYVYWEVTDEALERARGELGPAGREAWVNLRVYDVTSRIFDGTNAHHYFDHSVSRTDRQWFFLIGRPSSTVVVEMGLKSREGYFVRIARSGRTDFPRREPVAPGGVEWLTVHSAGGEVGEPVIGSRDRHAVIAAGAGVGGQSESLRVWDIRRTHGRPDGEWAMRDESFGTVWEEWSDWMRGRALEWEGPVVRTTWEAGPFTYPVEPVRYVEERYDGPVTVSTVNGGMRIVHGARQIVIRGLGARAERKVLAVWEVHHTWLAREGVAARTEGRAAGAAGGSEQLALGASEIRWRAASELRLGGASELYRLGASELRYLGASEVFYAGASEWRARGASELRFLGASEWQERGASEIRYAGASEWLQGGASERSWPRG